eukprot:TRINITY_DN5554_c0_g1_i1.p1 TRINITY_DN5554_c0_g1~~TRINITY_DN5554_c0_g1_i1.p1  ORF type:complete len:389 (+),score=115.64 TRINITY_DN5554_c0_g1_i1:127-1293(+)
MLCLRLAGRHCSRRLATEASVTGRRYWLLTCTAAEGRGQTTKYKPLPYASTRCLCVIQTPSRDTLKERALQRPQQHGSTAGKRHSSSSSKTNTSRTGSSSSSSGGAKGGNSSSSSGSGAGGSGDVNRTGQRAEEHEERREAVAQKSQKKWTIPNIITGGRICLVPVLGYWIATGDYKIALGGLAVASASDWLDGYLARRLNQKTVLGGILDPLADKLMVATVSVALGAQGLLPMPLVALMFGRDFLLIGGSIVHRARTKGADEGFFDLENLDWEVKPSLISKANTALQFVTLWAALSQGALGWPGVDPLHYLCVTTGAATLASGASYFVNSGIVTRSRGRVLTKVRAGREKIAHQREIVRSKVLEKREKLAEKSGRVREIMRTRRKAR